MRRRHAWVQGAENIPSDRPAIIASNHLSFCDSFFMPIVIRRKVTFLAKAEYFTTPGIKGRLTRSFMTAVGMVPIDRGDSDAARAALNTGVRVLAEGLRQEVKLHNIRTTIISPAAVATELTSDDLRDIENAASQINLQRARYPEHLEQMTGR